MAAAKTHVSLNVTDIDRSVAFYEAFFGVPAHKRRPDYANFDLDEPALKLALNAHTGATANAPGTLNHLGIVVDSADTVDAARTRLQLAGLVDLDEGETVCCYARQDKVWARDPDGNAWEIYTILDEHNDGVFEAPPQDTGGCTTTPTRCCGTPLTMAPGSGCS
jgi:catechol 2,3-dioxygenase-like lactoylglutathione lyase family enzyme